MLENPLGQLFGLLSFALGIYCFYQHDDRKLKIFMFVLQINNSVHYILLGASTAALSSLLSMVRTAISLKTSSKLVAWFFILISFVMGTYVAERWQDFLPVVGTCIGTYALFCLTGIRMRMMFLLGASFWLANNIVVGSIGGTLLEVTMISVNMRTIYGMYRKNRADQEAGNSTP